MFQKNNFILKSDYLVSREIKNLITHYAFLEKKAGNLSITKLNNFLKTKLFFNVESYFTFLATIDNQIDIIELNKAYKSNDILYCSNLLAQDYAKYLIDSYLTIFKDQINSNFFNFLLNGDL